LAMEGVRTLFGDDRVPVEAILAGADQMLMPPDLVVALGGVRDAVADGEITEERLDQSVRRILAQKMRRGLFDQVHEIGKHTSELQSRFDLVCRLLLEKKKKKERNNT